MAFQTQQNPFSFGAAPQAAGFGGFGAAKPAAFGAPQPAGAFGAAAPASNLFGTPQASTPFGAQPSTPLGAQPQSAPFGAGAPQTSAPAAFGSMFGAPQASASGFGSQFGAAAPSPFGAPAAQPAGQVGIPAYSSMPDQTVLREVEALRDAFLGPPGNPRYRFKTLLLNVVDNPAQRVKPPEVDELEWRQAVEALRLSDDPKHLWPVLAKSFEELDQRKGAQEDAMKENAELLNSLVAQFQSMDREQKHQRKQRLEAVKRKHAELNQMLLKTMRRVEALEGRLAVANMKQPSREATAEINRQLMVAEQEIAPNTAGGLMRKVEALVSAAQLRQDAPQGWAGGGIEGPALDEASLKGLFEVLQQNAEAIKKLQDVVRRDDRDLAIMQEQRGGVAPMS